MCSAGRGRGRDGEKETVAGQRDLGAGAVARDDTASGAYHFEPSIGVDVGFKEWFRRASSARFKRSVGQTWQGQRSLSPPSIAYNRENRKKKKKEKKCPT
jgi:hypothetical protein